MDKKKIKEEDLDFYLTIIYLFCQYNTAEHFSDKMFGDITSDIIKRDRIIEALEHDGYITAKKSVNIPHRYKIEITPLGIDFHLKGGYMKTIRNSYKQSAYTFFKKWIWSIIAAITTGLIGLII